ncbi:hypothetical protein NGA_0559800, partial [Nannochloropsis gaditana CCMP526]|uniref:uncharacterized protein n=1 Tax=Nannochloropsis gaditana (strain CCMP526) TaxID=1093141 RepID=UPI00029F7A28
PRRRRSPPRPNSSRSRGGRERGSGRGLGRRAGKRLFRGIQRSTRREWRRGREGGRRRKTQEKRRKTRGFRPPTVARHESAHGPGTVGGRGGDGGGGAASEKNPHGEPREQEQCRREQHEQQPDDGRRRGEGDGQRARTGRGESLPGGVGGESSEATAWECARAGPSASKYLGPLCGYLDFGGDVCVLCPQDVDHAHVLRGVPRKPRQSGRERALPRKEPALRSPSLPRPSLPGDGGAGAHGRGDGFVGSTPAWRMGRSWAQNQASGVSTCMGSTLDHTVVHARVGASEVVL